MRPAVSDLTEDLYASLGTGFTLEDEQHGWATLVWAEALAHPHEQVAELAADWSALFDVDRCPAWALPWLATVVGARLIEGLDEEGMRLTIGSINHVKRGTPEAIRASARQLLAGTRSIKVDERFDGDAYRVRIRTYEAETPDPVAVELAIRAEKPAGLVLTYAVFAGAIWQDLVDAELTWADVLAAFATWNDLRTWIPEEEPV